MRKAARDPAALVRRVVTDARFATGLLRLPPSVALFQWRARRRARREGDLFSLISATRPTDLAVLLKLAGQRRRVVELGTARAWTAIALALADPLREVTTYDPVVQDERLRYLELVAPRVATRIRFVEAKGADGPHDEQSVDLLYIDSSHDREDTIGELRAWQPALKPGALVVLDDYTHPEFPGVREAVTTLGLAGVVRGTLFVHEVAQPSAEEATG